MANDKPYLHLPLDEIRVAHETATAPNVGGIGSDAIVRGNPKILHDPTMGTCMRFDGDGDYIELTTLSSLTFAQGMTAMVWVRFEETPYFSRIFDLNVAQNQKSNILWAGNEERSQHLAFEVDGIRFRIENGVALRQWRHYAFVYDPAGKVSIIIDGALVFSKDVAFDIANTGWQTGYVGKSSYTADSLFRGAMAHFRLYNQALSRPEINDLMISDKSAMAHYRETTLLKVELYTVRDDDQKPILYIEADNKGEPLEVSLTNPGDKPVTFKPFATPTADDFHVQLRFRRNVIAPNVLRALQSDKSVIIEGWQHAAGTTADGREDFISFVKTDQPAPTLDKGQAWRIQIPNFSAAAQGGARNTRIQVRYRTEPQDPGSVVRHMEVQSHLGLKTIPLIARFRDSNTLLNNGQDSNELTIEVVYLNDTGSVRLDDASKFELIVDDNLITVTGDNGQKTISKLEAVSQTDWLHAQLPADGIGHKTIAIEVKRPEGGQTGVEPAALMEVTRDQALAFALSNWVTNRSSGTYNILLRYENIPGYWDGAWVLPVQFSPLVLRSDKIGIGTDEPGADLEIRRDVQGAVGPVLRLNNFGAKKGAGGAIDFNGYNVGKKTVTGPDGKPVLGTDGKPKQEWHDPTFRIQSEDDGNFRSDLVFSGKKKLSADSELEEKARITAAGRVKDRTGDIMPVGAIIAFGGQSAPDGWLLCDGQRRIKDDPVYSDLYNILKTDYVPDLRSRFIVGAGQGNGNDDRGQRLSSYPLNSAGGREKHNLIEDEMPSHQHSGTTQDAGAHNHKFTAYHANLSHGGKATESQLKNDDDGTFDYWTDWSSAHSHTFTTGSTGNNAPHENRPPFYALTYIIKY